MPPAGGAIVIANHSSNLDMAVVMAALPRGAHPAFAIADDYWYRGVLRKLYVRMLLPCFKISRRGDGYRQLAGEAIPLLAAGRVVVLFPEGGRTRDGTLRPFRSGAFVLADHTGAQVVPMAVYGAAHVLPVGKRWPRRAKIRIRIGAPLSDPTPSSAWAAIDTLLEHTRSDMAQAS